LAFLRGEAARYGCVPVSSAAQAETGSDVRLAATVAALRRVPTRGGPLVFMTLEDETGLLEAVVLPPLFGTINPEVTTPGPFLVNGKLRREQGAAHLEISRIAPFHKREKPFKKHGVLE
ncbi:MAG TPA: hypothetical protein VLS90_13040, partial [Thermodesulfobacteriota bacterium]|nr:hypothetical protein [Thermodesulfobacteriota bacterium]